MHRLLTFPTGDFLHRPEAGGGGAGRSGPLLRGPHLPPQPNQAYLTLVRQAGDAFAGDSDASVVETGRLACADLARGQTTDEVSIAARPEPELFEAYVVAIFATSYFCPQDGHRHSVISSRYSTKGRELLAGS